MPGLGLEPKFLILQIRTVTTLIEKRIANKDQEKVSPSRITAAYIEMEIHSFLNKPFITFQPHGKLVREVQPEIGN